jgi:LemA protein
MLWQMNYLIILSAVAIVLALWLVIGMRHLRRLRSEVDDQWELIDEDLRKRHDLLPNLVETLRVFDREKEELIAAVVEVRARAARLDERDGHKVAIEHELSGLINKMVDLRKDNRDLAQDTNFLELKKEIADIEENMEERSGHYNEMVRKMNKVVSMWWMKPLVKGLKMKKMKIFEVES